MANFVFTSSSTSSSPCPPQIILKYMHCIITSIFQYVSLKRDIKILPLKKYNYQTNPLPPPKINSDYLISPQIQSAFTSPSVLLYCDMLSLSLQSLLSERFLFQPRSFLPFFFFKETKVLVLLLCILMRLINTALSFLYFLQIGSWFQSLIWSQVCLFGKAASEVALCTSSGDP